MMEEKRKGIRIKKAIFIQFSYVNAEGKTLWDMPVVKDISELGACIITSQNLSVNETLGFRIRIPTHTNQIECLGKVVGIEKSTQGNTARIKFLNLEDKNMKLIENYINWIKSQEQV